MSKSNSVGHDDSKRVTACYRSLRTAERTDIIGEIRSFVPCQQHIRHLRMKDEKQHRKLLAAEIGASGYGSKRWSGGTCPRFPTADSMTWSAPTLCQTLAVSRVSAGAPSGRQHENHRCSKRHASACISVVPACNMTAPTQVGDPSRSYQTRADPFNQRHYRSVVIRRRCDKYQWRDFAVARALFGTPCRSLRPTIFQCVASSSDSKRTYEQAALSNEYGRKFVVPSTREKMREVPSSAQSAPTILWGAWRKRKKLGAAD